MQFTSTNVALIKGCHPGCRTAAARVYRFLAGVRAEQRQAEAGSREGDRRRHQVLHLRSLVVRKPAFGEFLAPAAVALLTTCDLC